eukprot:UC1_evm1s935
MEYVVYTTVHCDGFLNWDSNVSSYNIMNTPFKRDLYGELAQALRRHGLRVGAYVCPSLWNNNNYWAPDALSALGPVCAPNYSPSVNSSLWNTYLETLHALVLELSTKYQPDLFWFDCSNEPPNTDTRLDVVLSAMRKANPDVVINTRNGIFSDYSETNDQSESSAVSILTQTLGQNAGVHFEVPSVLQTTHQWAYDPTSGQKPASEILANLILL